MVPEAVERTVRHHSPRGSAAPEPGPGDCGAALMRVVQMMLVVLMVRAVRWC
jgi:hypothetical protein